MHSWLTAHPYFGFSFWSNKEILTMIVLKKMHFLNRTYKKRDCIWLMKIWKISFFIYSFFSLNIWLIMMFCFSWYIIRVRDGVGNVQLQNLVIKTQNRKYKNNNCYYFYIKKCCKCDYYFRDFMVKIFVWSQTNLFSCDY